jgi:hypothetical protein
MKIKKNTFTTLVLELFLPSIANCRKLKIQKNPKIDFPYCTVVSITPLCMSQQCQRNCCAYHSSVSDTSVHVIAVSMIPLWCACYSGVNDTAVQPTLSNIFANDLTHFFMRKSDSAAESTAVLLTPLWHAQRYH